jgi:L-xylulokinase
MWEATAGVIREVLAELDEPVLAVGLTAHGNGLYLVDQAGEAVRPAIMASDTRAASRVRRWTAAGLEPVLRTRSWNGLWAGQPGPLLAGLAEAEPAVLAAAAAALTCKDVIWARLTGAVETELTAASAGGLYDSAAWAAGGGSLAVSEPALAAFGLERWRHLLLTPIDPYTVRTISAAAAADTGLAPGTPVVAGVVDNVAMQHGSGVFDGGTICVGAGTWSINQVLVPARTAAQQAALVAPNAANIALGGMALFSEASPTSASTLDWARRRLGADSYDALFARERDRPGRLDDPVFLPFLDGSRSEPGARGTWLGLSSATTDADLVGAVIEGVCLEHRRHVDRLRAALPSPLPVRLSGGATRSEVWCGRFADALGVPVATSPVTELGSVCAAAMAGVGVGVFADVGAGVATLNPAWRVFEPTPARREFAQARYARYCRLAESFDHIVWEDS